MILKKNNKRKENAWRPGIFEWYPNPTGVRERCRIRTSRVWNRELNAFDQFDPSRCRSVEREEIVRLFCVVGSTKSGWTSLQIFITTHFSLSLPLYNLETLASSLKWALRNPVLSVSFLKLDSFLLFCNLSWVVLIFWGWWWLLLLLLLLWFFFFFGFMSLCVSEFLWDYCWHCLLL